MTDADECLIASAAALADADRDMRLPMFVAKHYAWITQELDRRPGGPKLWFWCRLAAEFERANIRGLHGRTTGIVLDRVWRRERDRRRLAQSEVPRHVAKVEMPSAPGWTAEREAAEPCPQFTPLGGRGKT